MSEFDEIRPYNDAEMEEVLVSLLSDNEFLDVIAALKLPRLGKYIKYILRPIIRKRLLLELQGVKGVTDFQAHIESYMGKLLNRTVTHLSVSGLEHLNKDQAYLFISNHRDIAMDPAFVNWALFHNGFSTLRIAIGDNLLTKPFASKLMRLNKSFIVNRSATAPRERFKAAKLLSKYIQHSRAEDNENIWIAQREGRAKDGIDKTNAAIINMIVLSKPKSQELAEYIEQCKIVPVSISYEYDPCDEAKARELYHREEQGDYIKEEHEDVQSIAMGLSGYKGAVHVSFAPPLNAPFDNIDDVAVELDRQINGNYVLHPTNCFAYEMLEGCAPDVLVGESQKEFSSQHWQQEREQFLARVDRIDEKWKNIFLKGYANPIYHKLTKNKLV